MKLRSSSADLGIVCATSVEGGFGQALHFSTALKLTAGWVLGLYHLLSTVIPQKKVSPLNLQN